MRLSSLSIRNFRSFKKQTIEFGKYTSLVGPNGSGKSTVLMALNVLFRQKANVATDVQSLTDEDFHNKDTSEPIVIEAAFTEISPKATEGLNHYVRHGQLVVKAIAKWDEGKKAAEVKHYGARLGVTDFKEFFEKHKSGTKKDLDPIYEGLREKHPDLPKATSKDDKKNALLAWESSHSVSCELIDSEDQFFGFQGAGALDPYLQWVYIPAVKDAASEQEAAKNTALGQLLDRTIKSKVDFSALKDLEGRMRDEYQRILETQKSALTSVSTSLETKLKTWAHADARIELKWNYDPKKSVHLEEPYARADVGESSFLGEIRRMGHGFQRSFIVTLLQELAACNAEASPTLLLGFEEPELYQHPPQARYLAGLLEDEDMKNTQVIATTHSPYFVSGKGVENVRLVRWDTGQDQSVVSSVTLENLRKRIGDALGETPRSPTSVQAAVQQIMYPSLNELFFSRLAVIVEGPEDIAFISAQLELSGLMAEFRKVGAHLIACGGKTSMSRPVAIACELGIPFFVIFDADAKDKTETANIRDNRCILNLCGCSNREPDPKKTVGNASENMVMWKSDIKKVVIDDITPKKWDDAWEKMKKQYGPVSDKNEMLITATLDSLYREGAVSASLDGLCRRIIALGKRHAGAT